MYPQFFGFHKLPFRLRPDPDFRYLGAEYLHARQAVFEAAGGNARVVLLTGPPGAGKTLLLDDVLREICGHFAVCRINQPHITAAELLETLTIQLANTVVETNAKPAVLLADVAAVLEAAGSRAPPPLLVIDDAHLLGAAALATIGDLVARAPRLKILLVAQDDPQKSGAGLAARVGGLQPLQVELQTLSPQSARAYVDYRLNTAGGPHKELFTEDAQAMVFQLTGGSPRLINGLCDAALHAACLRASGQVGSSEVVAATEDARWPEAVAREKSRTGPSSAVEDPIQQEDPSSTAGAQLLVSHQKEHIATWPLGTGHVSIGRASDNDLRLEAPFVSRHHCRIVTVGTESTVEDLGSVNGILVNGKSIKRHVLKHADRIMIGEHLLTYVLD